MSHAKRCANKGVANEGRDPKTGNRAATGPIPAVVYAHNIIIQIFENWHMDFALPIIAILKFLMRLSLMSAVDDDC